MSKMIIDNESNTAFLDELKVSLTSITMFEPEVVPPTGYHRRIYESGVKHYVRSKNGIKTFNPTNEKFDLLFDRKSEISAVDSKIRSGQIKVPVRYEG